ncbi:MAG: HNH endonuclease family protein, partial [Spirochaetota bacterium]
IIQTGHEVRIEKLFSEYKTWLKDKGLEGKRAFMVELKQYASYYVEFPSGQDFNQITFNEHEKRFFHLLENLSITTAYPLVLYLYKTVADKAILAAMLRILEAYLVRRNVCRLTTKNYNQLFMQIINSLARIRDSKGSLESADLRGVLAAFADDSTRVPSNAEFKAAFATETLSNRNSREILFCLALHHSGNGLNDMQRLSLSDFSVEHMMPRSWEANWTTRQMDADEKALRNWKLRTLGNLTLVTKKLNSAMQNSAWNQKRDFLRPNSALRMTTEYLGLAAWDETTIDSRAGDLATTALAIWPF